MSPRKSPKDWSPDEERLSRVLAALQDAVRSKEAFFETLEAVKEMAADAAESADEARDREETRFWDRATATLDIAIKDMGHV
jgi:hypothetical protein